MTDTKLPACPYTGSDNVRIIYDGPIRSGGADSGFEDGYRVLFCEDSGLAWLDPVPSGLEEYYTTDSYWSEHHQGKAEVEHLRKKLDHEQPIWLEKTGYKVFRDKTVADFGCGAGIFFDYIKGLASRCVGIDLVQAFADHFEQEGYEFRSFGKDLGESWADVAVSFDTLEHVPQPWDFLKQIHQVLKPDGRLYLGVPNYRDFLKQLAPGYLRFFYHKSHLWFFSIEALSRLIADAGFTIVETGSVHKYDLNNMLVWTKDGKPSGRSGSPVFDSLTEAAFKANVERQGMGSHILIVAEKSES